MSHAFPQHNSANIEGNALANSGKRLEHLRPLGQRAAEFRQVLRATLGNAVGESFVLVVSA